MFARTHSIPASPNTPWLTVRASAKAPCRICILPTGIIPRVESWTRSRSKRAYFVTKQTTLCAISCCQSSFCSSTLASYHLFLPKAPNRWHGHHWAVVLSAFWLWTLGAAPGGSLVTSFSSRWGRRIKSRETRAWLSVSGSPPAGFSTPSDAFTALAFEEKGRNQSPASLNLGSYSVRFGGPHDLNQQGGGWRA